MIGLILETKIKIRMHFLNQATIYLPSPFIFTSWLQIMVAQSKPQEQTTRRDLSLRFLITFLQHCTLQMKEIKEILSLTPPCQEKRHHLASKKNSTHPYQPCLINHQLNCR